MPDLKSFMKSAGDELALDIFKKTNNLPTSNYIDPSLTDKYMSQEGFNPLGFNPTDTTNFDRYVAKENAGTAWKKAWDGFGYSFNNTFTDYWKQYGRIFNAAINWDWSKMNRDEASLLDQDFQYRLNSNKNYVFTPRGTEDDIFTLKSMSEFISNAGFMAGTTAGMFLELAADAAITIATSGGGLPAIAGKWASKKGIEQVGKTILKEGVEEIVEQGVKQGVKKKGLINSFTDFGKQFQRGYGETVNMGVDEIRNLNKTKQVIDGASKLKSPGSDIAKGYFKETIERLTFNMGNVLRSKSFAEGAGNLMKGLPVVGNVFRYGEKIAAGAGAGLSMAHLTGIGVAGGRRMLQEINMAGTEASFEAVGAYGETMRRMIDDYEGSGRELDGAAFKSMSDYAMKAAGANYNTNLAILLATNHITFGNMWNRFNPGVKWLGDMLKEQGGKAITVGGLKDIGDGTVKKLWKVYQKGLTGTFGVAYDVAKDYGVPKALAVLGKSTLKSMTRFEITEGIQELLQETSTSAWVSYYANQSNGLRTNLAEAFEEGAMEQWSKQGLKIFLMGAFTGTMMRGPMNLGSMSIEKLQQYAQDRTHIAQGGTKETTPWRVAEQQTKDNIKDLNEFFFDVATTMKFNTILTFDANNQFEAAEGMINAAAKNDKYAFINYQDNALLSMVLKANQVNAIDAFIYSIREAANMTPEEFQNEFGINIKDTQYTSVSEFANKVADDAVRYSKVVDKYRMKVRNLTDDMVLKQMFQYKEFYTEPIFRAAQEEAIRIIAAHEISGSNAVQRAKSVSDAISRITGLSNSADWGMKVLQNPDAIKAEIGIIMKELADMKRQVQDENISAETKAETEKQIKLKEQEIDLLQEWTNMWVISDRSITEMRYETVKEKKIVNGKEVEVDKKVEVGEDIVKRRYNFMGVKETIERTDEAGNKTIEEQFNPKSKRVAELFARIINIKNKQAGNTTEISIDNAIEGLDNIIDYFKLDQDARDYMRAIEAINNPMDAKKMVERISEGLFKYNLLGYLENVNGIVYQEILSYFTNTKLTQEQMTKFMSNMNEIINNVVSKIENNEAYKEISIIIASDEFGLQNSKRIQELMKQLQEFFGSDNENISKIIEEEIKKFTGEAVQETETTEETEDEVQEEAEEINEVIVSEEDIETEVIPEIKQPVQATTHPLENKILTKVQYDAFNTDIPKIPSSPYIEQMIVTPEIYKAIKALLAEIADAEKYAQTPDILISDIQMIFDGLLISDDIRIGVLARNKSGQLMRFQITQKELNSIVEIYEGTYISNKKALWEKAVKEVMPIPQSEDDRDDIDTIISSLTKDGIVPIALLINESSYNSTIDDKIKIRYEQLLKEAKDKLGTKEEVKEEIKKETSKGKAPIVTPVAKEKPTTTKVYEILEDKDGFNIYDEEAKPILDNAVSYDEAATKLALLKGDSDINKALQVASDKIKNVIEKDYAKRFSFANALMKMIYEYNGVQPENKQKSLAQFLQMKKGRDALEALIKDYNNVAEVVPEVEEKIVEKVDKDETEGANINAEQMETNIDMLNANLVDNVNLDDAENAPIIKTDIKKPKC